MKLLYITNGINGPGGLERVLSIKASQLAEQYDYEVSILVLNNSHLNPFYGFSPKIRFYSVEMSGNLISGFLNYKKGIQKIVEEVQPDMISVCDDGLKGFYVPSFLNTKAKIIYERHASVNLNAGAGIKGKLIRMLMHRQISKFDRFVVLTNGNLKEWNQPNVMVIPNPLGFQSEQSAELENKKIIAVGSHSCNKGYDLLIRVWKIIQNQKPDWVLNIYGKIDPDRTFVKMSEKEGLKNIFFKSPIKDIRSAYLDASILVMSSRSEGFGMVLTEAMACGLPCVAFDCPSGPADIIKEGEDGFLIPVENTSQMADRLLQLIEDKTLRKQMGKSAKQNVKRFSADEILKRWDELFKELLNKDQPTEKIK